MPMMPEIKNELLAAAERQARPQGARGFARRRRALGLALVGAVVVASGAVAAGTGVFEAGQGATPQGSYHVRAVTDGKGGVCLALRNTETGRTDGQDPTCTPKPFTGLVGDLSFGYIDGGQRLIYGVVSPDVDKVTVQPGDVTSDLHDVAGAPGRYFDTVVAGDGVIRIAFLGRDGQVLSRIDGSSYGPVGRGAAAG